MLFDGCLQLDIAGLRNDLADKKAQLEQERILNERKGGLSHEELSRKIMEGIVNGALDIRHCEAAPYSHGFEVTFRAARKGIGTRWTCFCPLPQVAEQIACQIEQGTPMVDTPALLAGISSAEQNKITFFVLESNSGLCGPDQPADGRDESPGGGHAVRQYVRLGLQAGRSPHV